jgi:hypothetical protein
MGLFLFPACSKSFCGYSFVNQSHNPPAKIEILMIKIPDKRVQTSGGGTLEETSWLALTKAPEE